MLDILNMTMMESSWTKPPWLILASLQECERGCSQEEEQAGNHKKDQLGILGCFWDKFVRTEFAIKPHLSIVRIHSYAFFNEVKNGPDVGDLAWGK